MFERTLKLLVAMLVLLVGANAANAQQYSPGGNAPAFTQQQLDQIMAPIALYPDALLSQIMMAATYPREVTEAADWSRRNPDFDGDRAVRAVERYDWDPSVKSLVAFPQILAMMDEKLNWTEDLGDAFLDQQAQVMDTVQYLRRQAYTAGNLRSSDQFRVDVRDSSFVIDFVNPEIAYLPYYNPVVVYGTWWWPAQPVYWAPWRGYAVRPGYHGYAWGPPIRVSRGFFYGAPDWRERRVNVVNVNNFYYRAPNAPRMDEPRRMAGAPHVWQHDEAHRRDVPRRDAGWRQPAARVDTAPRMDASPDGRRDGRDREAPVARGRGNFNEPAVGTQPQARPAPVQPVAAMPVPNSPRERGRGPDAQVAPAQSAAPVVTRGEAPRADSRGNDARGSEQRERAQRRDPRFDSNRATDRADGQPQQPTTAAPVARAPVAAPTPPVVNQTRVAPAPMPVPTPPPVAARPVVEPRPAVAAAPRAPEGGGRQGDSRQGGSHERGHPPSNDNTVAAAPPGNGQAAPASGNSRGNGGTGGNPRQRD